MADHILKQSAEVDARDRKQYTPLILACRKTRLEAATLLIENGANVRPICGRPTRRSPLAIQGRRRSSE